MDANRIGKRGENMFATLIMEPWERTEPFFDPTFFGDKFPGLDHYVELVGAKIRCYFFVQVKSTSQGYEQVGGRRFLKVRVSKRDLNELAAFPAPTYVVGIDEERWQAYLLSANQTRTAISKFPTRFPLNRENMKILWDEVAKFWSNRDMVLRNSYFRE